MVKITMSQLRKALIPFRDSTAALKMTLTFMNEYLRHIESIHLPTLVCRPPSFVLFVLPSIYQEAKPPEPGQ